MKARKWKDLIIYRLLPLVAFVGFICFPFYWTLVTSLKVEGDIIKRLVRYLPDPATIQNYVTAWRDVGFSQYFLNSLLVSAVACLMTVASALLVGYALSRFKFKGKQPFMLVLLCTQFIPSAMLIIPLFITFSKLHLINNHWSLILVYTTFQIPFSSIMMKGFVEKIPYHLEEAAYVDGCSRFQALVKVVLPVLTPGVVACASFSFISCWNEFLFALMFVNNTKKFTIPVGLSFMQGQFDINYGALAAGSMIALAPAILMFIYVQKYLVGGLTAGAVKG